MPRERITGPLSAPEEQLRIEFFHPETIPLALQDNQARVVGVPGRDYIHLFLTKIKRAVRRVARTSTLVRGVTTMDYGPARCIILHFLRVFAPSR
jgi:hypothetical protein